MKATKLFSTLTLLLLSCTVAFAQPGDKGKPGKEKVKAMKVGYITEKLDLTPEEAQQFWPIYNEFDDKMEAVHRELRKTHKQDESIDDLSDAEVEKMINTITDLRKKEFAIEQEYHEKFKKVLPIKKIAKLYKANHDFKRDLLEKIKNHKGGPQGPPPGRPPMDH
ncbi:MAG: sensor of ECF-type sigma factor [Flavobacteriales bacterium]|nr:sensor of ECF-type sigma factor [Flavobacteriales bacterium]